LPIARASLLLALNEFFDLSALELVPLSFPLWCSFLEPSKATNPVTMLEYATARYSGTTVHEKSLELLS